MPAYPGGIFGTSNTNSVPGTGAGGTVTTPFSTLDAVAQNPIGSTILWNGAIYRYVKFAKGTGTVSSAVGGPAWPTAITAAATATAQPIFTVTADQTDSIMGQTPVGVFGAIIVAATYDLYYTYVQVGGIAQCVVPGSIEEDMIIGSTSDNQFAKIAAGSNLTRPMVGVRLEGASSAGLSPVLLCNMNF